MSPTEDINCSGERAYAPANQRDEFERFVCAHPFYENPLLDEWRASEYARLDAQGQVYLDYTGGSLYGQSQLDQHFALLRAGVFGNPHSANPTSLATTELLEETRQHVLDYFNAPADEYALVFTANASGALKLVGESYPFEPDGQYLLTFDNHNSVNGIREFAAARGADVRYAPLTLPELRIDEAALERALDGADRERSNLFAFPAQSNFSGVKHSLDWIARARARGWDVLLDAAAFAPTNRLDLSATRPDFVALSFYKMFGYPTGVGALLARKEALAKLRRPWFAGGTVNFASVQARGHLLASEEAGFEDGTLNYLVIPAVKLGLQHLERVGAEGVGARVESLTGWMLEQLLALRHANGKPMVRLYGPADTRARGGTITLNLYDPQGRLLDYRRVEELANEAGISIRTGCFCNPGAGELAEGLTEADMRLGLRGDAHMNLPRFLEIIQHAGNKSAGAIRVSLGIASNFADAYRFLGFASGFRDQTNLALGQARFNIEGCRARRDAA